ncbi:MAG: SoxR reducing system RseC family protein [Bacteroides sp.]|jgi:sigma-E factor negative regulatory protein RseC|nr:SoxR reducing system RseC family protein [Bacteroides sp.]
MRQNQIPEIEHPGIVDHLDGGQAYVRIQAQAACGSCHAKSYCGMAEVTDKVVEVCLEPDERVEAGQQVTVTLKRSLGFRALFLGYLLPFLILLASLFILMALTGNEGFSALVSLALMVPYYGILYFNREKIRSIFTFRIKG